MKIFNTILTLIKTGIIFSITLLFTHCKNDFEVNDDWKDITVVYGILNQNEDTNYIRVTKGFLGVGDAGAMAQVKDSLYYKNVNVILEEWSNNILHNTFTLRDTTYIRYNSVFNDTNIVFYTTASLSPNYTYKLKVLEGGKEITSETPLLENVDFIRGSSSINLHDQISREINWYTKPNEKIFEVKMRFYYYEVYNDNTQKKDSIDIPLPETQASTISGNEKLSIVISANYFLYYVGSLIKDNPDVHHRIVADSCFTFTFLIGSEKWYTYMLVNKPTLGMVNDKPVFTNINNGIGLFTSRLSMVIPYKYRTTNRTVDALSLSSFTQNLKFLDYSQTINIWIYYP